MWAPGAIPGPTPFGGEIRFTKKTPAAVSSWLTVVLITVIPVVFYRNVLDSFDLTKATLLWVGATPVCVSMLSIGWSRLAKNVENRALAVFLCLFAIASFTSIRPWSSLFGQYQRYTGFLTYLSVAAIFLFTTHVFDKRWQCRAITGIRIAAVICSAYVMIQALGLDPWEWSSPGQNKPLFGTMGNINTSSGFLGLSAPLFVLGILNRNRLVRMSGVAGLLFAGGAIGLNESFQGNVAGIVSVVILVFAAIRATHPSSSLTLVIVALVFFVSGFAVDTKQEIGALVIVIGVLSSFLGLCQAPLVEGKSWVSESRGRLWAVLSCASAVLVLISVAFGPRIIREFRGGMVERSAFYRSALGLWIDRPLLGYGPETFGYIYSIKRPTWHAIDFEGNRPSSVHSVPLGLLVSAGLFAFVAYVVFVILVLRRGIRGVRSADAENYWTRVCILGAFVAATLQSLVSVEHVALLTVFFSLAGLTVASSQDHPADFRIIGNRSTRQSGLILLSMALIPSILLLQLSRPFRADFYARRGMEQAYQENDIEAAFRSIDKAVELAPWDPQQLLKKVSLLQQVGDPKTLAPAAIRLSEMFNCLPSVSIGAAFAAGANGDFSKAQEIGRCTVDHDPHSIVVKEAIAELYAQMGEAALQAGKLDVASEFLRDALNLDSANPRALVLRGSLSASVG